MRKTNPNLLDEQHLFNRPSHPSKPRILFIGLSESSHARSFTDLFIDDFDIRFFALPTHSPPHDWPVKTYITCANPPANMDSQTRFCFYPTPEERDIRDITQKAYEHRVKWNPVWFIERLLQKSVNIINRRIKLGKMEFDFQSAINDLVPYRHLPVSRFNYPQDWLADIIDSWQPDIIHTFGNNACEFLLEALENKEEKSSLPGIWVHTIFGGADLDLTRLDPIAQDNLRRCLQAPDYLIADNWLHIEYLKDLDIPSKKIASISPVPGFGGINLQEIQSYIKNDPSKRKSILWPKAYLCPWSLSLPVLEAIQLAWAQIQPCTIYMLAMDHTTRMWFHNLPNEIQEHCIVYERIPWEETIKLMAESRVMLAPSLIDGMPNVIYEAMAAGALPIVSPLDTIKSMISEENVLFARNMYPQEIADALILAMNDDDLIAQAAIRNAELVNKIANRSKIRKKVLSFYKGLI